jgi:hypothetical protein
MRYLLPPTQKTLADFINSAVWRETRMVLEERLGEQPHVSDPSHVAAAKGHRRAGAESIIKQIEQLPFEVPPEAENAFARPAVAFTQD